MFDQELNAELVNKLYHLNKSLDEAQLNIKLLQKENSCLKDVLANLTSLNKEDYADCLENYGDPIISI